MEVFLGSENVVTANVVSEKSNSRQIISHTMSKLHRCRNCSFRSPIKSYLSYKEAKQGQKDHYACDP